MLPEDLRSSIIKNYGRRQIKEYGDDLLAAVAFWRQAGAWRSKLRKKESSAITPGSPAVANASQQYNVIALAERRRSFAVQTTPYSDDESEQTPPRSKTAMG